MDRQVGVALPVAGLGVGEARVVDALPGLVVRLHLPEREGAEGLGEEGPRLHLDRHLAGAGPEELPLHPEPVAQVQEVQVGEGLVAQDVLPEVELDLPVDVLHVGEGALAVAPPAHDPAPHLHRLLHLPLLGQLLRPLRLLEDGDGGPAAMARVEVVGEGLDAALPQGVELLPADAEDLVQVFGHGFGGWWRGIRPPRRTA